jgi:hypothetical protein
MIIKTTIILFIYVKIINILRRRNKVLKAKNVSVLYIYYIYRLEAIRIVKSEYQGDLEFAEGITNFVLKERMIVLVRGANEEN